MSAFNFVALDQNGRQQKGVLEADGIRQVRQLLRDKGWAPLAVEPTVKKAPRSTARQTRSRASISTGDLALLTRQLSTLIGSSLPVVEALKAVAEQSEKSTVTGMIMSIRSRVKEGYSLADSMAEFPKAFPKLYRSTVAAGEKSGHLVEVLDNLADYTESKQNMQRNISQAMIYPIILLIMCLAILAGLLVKVVPNIISMFDNTGRELPTITKMLIASSNFLTNNWLMILLTLASIIVFFMISLKNRSFRAGFDRFILKMPVVGKLSVGINCSRFASTLSILTSSGVPLVEAMKIACEVVTNIPMRDGVVIAAIKVSEGATLKNSLELAGYFPPMMLHMIASGESSGELDLMLRRVADNQEKDFEHFVSTLVNMLGPLMLLVMGAMVLTVVMAILQPIMDMTNII